MRPRQNRERQNELGNACVCEWKCVRKKERKKERGL